MATAHRNLTETEEDVAEALELGTFTGIPKLEVNS